jgi:hypothetical protein
LRFFGSVCLIFGGNSLSSQLILIFSGSSARAARYCEPP